jgi:RNA polymerase sigma-70 factor (ECF subfamily)
MLWMSRPAARIEELLASARQGDRTAIDQILDLYRNYLYLLARTQIDMNLARRVTPSDAVQETLLRAFKNFSRFRGASEAELVGWLRQILARSLADQARQARSLKRDVQREQAWQAGFEQSSRQLAQLAAAKQPSPSEIVSQREQSVLLADALARLPADYREIIVLRHLERIEFAEIAARLGRSSGAVRMLWARALERLRRELETLE